MEITSFNNKSACDNIREHKKSSLLTHNNDEKLMSNTVIVFDYDDTIFPTTKLKEIAGRPGNDIFSKITESELNDLIHLSLVTLNVLSLYILHYSRKNISIVTAASNGWIQQSLGIVYKIGYFSQIYQLLFPDHLNQNNNDDILQIFNPTPEISKSFKSKKQYFQISEYPVFKWKYNVFKHILKQKYANKDNVINTFTFIGDSEWEYQASKALRHNYCKTKNLFIDGIKLLSKPSFNSLKDEQTLIYGLCGKYEINSLVNKTVLDINYLEWQQKANQRLKDKSGINSSQSH